MVKNIIPGKGRRVLYIAYHFPPLQGSTGIARTLAFAKYLKQWNWEVTVLTLKPSAYPEVREQNYATIPNHVHVERASALDAQKHLSLLGRYPLFLAVPDKWQSWIVTGLFRALSIIRKWKPDAIISTYPIASAHCIGYLAHKITGIPWIADFRDPMVQPSYPAEKLVYRSYQLIEKLVFANAARITVTTQGTADLYAARFPNYPRENIVTISNGFDPEMFPSFSAPAATGSATGSQRTLRLLHSGLVYPEERNPTQLFEALSALKQSGAISAGTLNVLFRASGNETTYQQQVDQLGISDIAKFLPPIPYQEAVNEMIAVDGLLLLQASNCNQQIPAKLYEYLYCGKPILGLTDPEGDTGGLLQQLGVRSVAKLDNTDDIKIALTHFIEAIRQNSSFVVPRSAVLKFSRRELTADLAAQLDQISAAGHRS